MKFKSCLFFLWMLCFACKLHAQDEIYEPVPINDTLDSQKPKDQKTKQKEKDNGKEDARTELEKKKDRLQRIRIGGAFGLQFGTFTYVNISPTVGYMVVKNRLELGGGPIFIFERYRVTGYYDYKFFVYGPDIYARGFLWKGLYLESRYDLVNKPSYVDLNKKIWVNHLLLGAGYAAPLGKAGFLNVSLLYNVLNNSESIYKGTFGNFPLILNVGLGFGLGGKD